MIGAVASRFARDVLEAISAVARRRTCAGSPAGRDGQAGGAGQGLVEYGLIVAGIAVVAVITLVFFGDQVAAVLDLIGNAIDRATGA